MDVFSELRDIHKMLNEASTLASVRHEVNKVIKDGSVMDGKHHEDSGNFDVIVKCGKDERRVTKSLLNIPDIEIERIANGVLGVRDSRRK